MELVHQAEIARRLDLSRQRVSVLAQHEDFPRIEQRNALGGAVRYDWDAVKAWHFRRSERCKESCDELVAQAG